MPVDPWSGYNQGLASLGETFDTLSTRRRQEEMDARQARIDALQEPILRAQGEGAVLDLGEKRRKITDLRAYDAARRELEANPGTVPTIVKAPNLDYQAPQPMTSISDIKGRTAFNATSFPEPSAPDQSMLPTGATPAVGLPTMDVASTRPPNSGEMAFKRMTLALQHGQPIGDIGATYDLSEKLRTAEGSKIVQFATTMKSIKAGMGVGYAKQVAPLIAQQLGLDPKLTAQYEPVPGGNMFLAPNGSTYLVDDDGKFLHEFKPQEPKSPTQIDVETKAAQGDPLATKIIKDQEARKIRLKQIEAGSGGGGAAYVPGPSAGIPGERNEGVLKGLSQGDAATVKGLVDYKIPLPSGFALKTPWGQRILGAASMYDPSFDATQYNVRLRLKQDFTSGKSAQNIRSLNTAISHLESLDKSVTELGNSSYPIWNAIANRGISAVGDPRVNRVMTNATAVESELASVFKGTGATDQEIKAWRERFDTSGSPEQLKKGGIDGAIELLSGRLQALQSQYETGLGKPKDFHFLSEKSRTILKKLGANVDMIDGVASGKTSATPAPSGIPAGAVPVPGKVTKAGKTVYQLPNGKYWAED